MSQSNPSVLVVENYSDLAMMISVTLKQRGYDCEAVREPEQAIRLLETREFEAILIDLTWPPVTNVVLSFLQNSQPAQLRKVIVMTGFDPHYLGIEELSTICTFLRKPFGIDELLARIAACD